MGRAQQNPRSRVLRGSGYPPNIEKTTMTFGFLRAEFRSLTKDDILRDCGGNSLNNYGRLAVIDSQGCSISLVSYND